MAKGGKGRKGGGGGGGKTRKYSRDNKGRFASTGSGGATARGGRLATAKGNKRKTQTITATGQKGVLAKPKGLKPGSIGLKPAAAKPARFSASELAERKGYAKQLMAQPKGVRKANYLARKAQKTPDQLDRFKGRIKFGTQNTINNITEGRNYLTAKKSQLTNTSEKRASIERSVTNSGRSLQARMKTTNLGTRLRRLNKPVTTKAAKTKGTIGKPKGLKPESTNKLKTGIFISKRRAVNAQLANKPDQAVVNIPGRFTGRAGKSFDASITRAVATVKASKDAKFKTKAEVKADQAKAKAAKEAKPKRIRSAESLRVSRAKQIEKRRSITTNPAGVRASAAAKMAANATRTQQRAAAFYKAGGKPAAAAKPATRKEQLAAGAKKRTAQADRIDAKIKKLESEYRGKDAAFYTQGAKPAGRDRMIAKSQKAAQLREESASLRTKAANAERMSSKIKDKPIKSSGGNKRLDRAIKNEAAGSTSYKRNPKGYQKRITALTAQKVYQTGDATTGLSVAQYAGKGFRLPRNQRAASAKPAAPKALTPAERIKIKTPIIRAKRANRASVVTPGQRSRLETGKGAKIKGARLNSSVAKPRTAGNTKPQVASRVKRKLAAENAKMNQIQRRERIGARQGKQYERSLKREMLLERAKTFLESGKLPGKDNSIAAQRNTKQARQRLAAKNAERRSAATKPAAAKRKSVGSISEAKAGRIISRLDANRPGLRRASGSARKTANAIRTQQRATDFALAASARGRKQGKNLSVNQSLQRAIKNASAKRKPRGMR
jgi:hypothetical protein